MSRRAGRGGTGELPDQDGGDGALELDLWQLGVVLEGGRAASSLGGLGDPELGAVQLPFVAAGSLFGVGNAVAGRHEVHLARRDHLLAQRPGRDTTNDTDEIFSTGGEPAVLDVTPESDGYRAAICLVLPASEATS